MDLQAVRSDKCVTLYLFCDMHTNYVENLLPQESEKVVLRPHSAS